MTIITKEEVTEMVEAYISNLKESDKTEDATLLAWRVINREILTLNKGFPHDDLDVDFVVQIFVSKGISKHNIHDDQPPSKICNLPKPYDECWWNK